VPAVCALLVELAAGTRQNDKAADVAFDGCSWAYHCVSAPNFGVPMHEGKKLAKLPICVLFDYSIRQRG
jgi:hypothetical protein